MPAPTTATEFLELLRKSNLVEASRLEESVTKLQSAGLPEKPSQMAEVCFHEGLVTQFQAEQLLQGKWRRFSLGKYQVLEKLGSGGMGQVYLCEHKLMRRRVAVKVLPTSKASDPASLDRFYREARAVAALDHPNIVRAYDIDHDDKLHFLVMEHVDGASLQEIIKKCGPLDHTRACHYIRQSALGLQHAHEKAGLVHRDVKPGNILVDRNGIVKVLDMGLARFFHDEDDDITKKYDESVLGTADYLAPEQALDSHAADIRADIYSLGGTFYFCLTGQPPFGEGSVAQKLIWHQTRQPKSITAFRSDVPEGVLQIVEAMMAKDRDERYLTPQEVVEALTAWTQSPIAPPPQQEMPVLSPALRAMPSFSDIRLDGSSPSSPQPGGQTAWEIAIPAPSSKATKPSMRPPTPSPRHDSDPKKAPTPPTSPPPSSGALASPVPSPGSKAQSDSATQPVPASAPTSPAPVQEKEPIQEVPTVPQVSPIEQEVAPVPEVPAEALVSQTELEEEDSGAFAEISSFSDVDTEDPSSWEHTPSSGRKSPKPARSRTKSPNKSDVSGQKKSAWIWIAIAGVLLAGGGIAAALLLTGDNPDGKGGGPNNLPPQVAAKTLDVGEGRKYVSLQHAFRDVNPGDRIVVHSPIQERVSITERHRKTLANVTIEAVEGSVIDWVPPKDNTSNLPLLKIQDVGGIQIRGFRFDGQKGQISDLIRLTYSCPGVLLEKLEFKGYKRSAVHFVNCEGTEARPIVLQKSAVVDKPIKIPPLLLEALESVSEHPRVNHVVVRDCDFGNLPPTEKPPGGKVRGDNVKISARL